MYINSIQFRFLMNFYVTKNLLFRSRQIKNWEAFLWLPLTRRKGSINLGNLSKDSEKGSRRWYMCPLLFLSHYVLHMMCHQQMGPDSTKQTRLHKHHVIFWTKTILQFYHYNIMGRIYDNDVCQSYKISW